MKRRTLDIVFSIGGLLLAILVLILGLVLQNQANFSSNYVRTQLLEQKITFSAVADLSAKHNQNKQPCLIQNAGKLISTGIQAECYANEQIALDVLNINNGLTFAQTSKEASTVEKEAKAAAASGATDAASLEAQYTTLSADKSTLFEGQTERGLLLTTYGFSILGDRAHDAALVCFLVALILLLAAIAGMVHAFSPAGRKQILAVS